MPRSLTPMLMLARMLAPIVAMDASQEIVVKSGVRRMLRLQRKRFRKLRGGAKDRVAECVVCAVYVLCGWCIFEYRHA